VVIDVSSSPARISITLNTSVAKGVTADPFATTILFNAHIPIKIYNPTAVTNLLLTATTAPYFYVVDKNNHRVQAFYYEGDFAFSFGSYGSGEGEFKYPDSISNDGDYLYVTDTGNNRIEVFDLYGNFKYILNPNKAVLDKPLGIGVDDDFVYVISYDNKKLFVLTKESNSAVVGYIDLSNLPEEPTEVSVDIDFVYLESEHYTYKYSKDKLYTRYIFTKIPQLSIQSEVISSYNRLFVDLPGLDIAAESKETEIFLKTIGVPLPIHFELISFQQYISTELNHLTSVIYLEDNNLILDKAALPSAKIFAKGYSTLDIIVNAKIKGFNTNAYILSNNQSLISSELQNLGIRAFVTPSNIEVITTLPKLLLQTTDLFSIENSKCNIILPSLEILSTLIIEENLNLQEKVIVLHTHNNAVTEYYGNEIKFTLPTIDSFYPVKMKMTDVFVTGKVQSGTAKYHINDNLSVDLPIVDFDNTIKEKRIKLPKGVKNRYLSLGFVFDKDFIIHNIHIIGYSLTKRRR